MMKFLFLNSAIMRPSNSAMSLNDLKHLVRIGEGMFLEFKRTVSSPEKIAREISAFANTNGGTLLVGVDDNKSLYGVESYYEQEFLLEQAARDYCSPALDYQLEFVPYRKREIMLMKVPEAVDKPVYVKNGKRNKVFVRKDDKSIRANRETIEVLKRSVNQEGVTFEYGPKEQKLMRYLSEYERITVGEYSRIANISMRHASKTLVDLTSAGILELFPSERNDYFTLAQPS